MILRARSLLFFFICLVLTGSACADQQQELKNLRDRILSVQAEIERTSESKSEIADNLRESERAISTINRKLSQLSAQQRAADAKLNELERQQIHLRSALAQQQTILGMLLYQQYLGGRQEHLRVLLSSRNPNQLARDLHYYKYIARNRASQLSKLSGSLSSLNAVRTHVQAKRAELASLRTEQSSQKKQLDIERRARQRMLSKISSQLQNQRREYRHLRQNESRLANLVERISDMLTQPQSGNIFRNDKLPHNRFDGRPFNQLKGKLLPPVKGQVTNRFNTPIPDSTVLWKGIFLRTNSGQPVKAVAAGRVVFADWLRGFGNLLIIDHGNNFMSLYGYNETLYKQVGDELMGGDTIAAVGNSGGHVDFGLYFEIRYKSKPLDPMQWLATR